MSKLSGSIKFIGLIAPDEPKLNLAGMKCKSTVAKRKA
jgi:hypothetical protein